MAFYEILALFSLVLQILAFLLIVVAMGLKARRKLRLHGIGMLAAVVLHNVTLLVVMVPSFSVGLIPYISEKPLSPISLISMVHGITGLLAWLLGIWIVASWHLSTSLQNCTRKKGVMRATLVSWLIALIFGFLIYLNFYTTILPL
ncbi:MAG: hypothetical protein ACPLKQ_04340 [Candidatus Bathyarchaeales archaeon]